MKNVEKYPDAQKALKAFIEKYGYDCARAKRFDEFLSWLQHDADSFLEKVESVLKRLEDGRREARDRNEGLDEDLVIDCLTDFDRIIEEERKRPRRNCDVMDAKELYINYKAFCDKQPGCKVCPLGDCSDNTRICMMSFALSPCEERKGEPGDDSAKKGGGK